MTDDELPLLGGRVTADVVRIGNTVRRPPRMNAEFVHALLDHLAAAGFEGEVPADLGWHDDDVLVAAARLIRRFHDATVGLVTRESTAPLEVVCHNDLSPCNFVFRAGVPVALIDFDTAAPGTRRMDLGYAAWGWLDLGDPDMDIKPEEQRRRLRLFAAAYGNDISATSIKEAIVDRQQWLAAEGEHTGRTAMA